jgi:hypothetical protein
MKTQKVHNNYSDNQYCAEHVAQQVKRTIPSESVDDQMVQCRFHRNGICILSDCRCQKSADIKLQCSSFTKE